MGSRPDGDFYKFSAYSTVYRGGPMVLLQTELYFPKDPEGVQHFPGWEVQMLISIENHITCDFSGGSGPPIPLWIRTCHPSTTTSE